MPLEFFRVSQAIEYTLGFYEIDRIKEYMFNFAGHATSKIVYKDKSLNREWHELVIGLQNRMDEEIMQHMLISNSTGLAYLFHTLESWVSDYHFVSVHIPTILNEIEQYNTKVYEEFLLKVEINEEKFKATENYNKYNHLDKIPIVHKGNFGLGLFRFNEPSNIEFTTEEVYHKFISAYCPHLIDIDFLPQYISIVKELIDNFKWIVNKHSKQYQSLKNTLPYMQAQVLLPATDHAKIIQPTEITESIQLPPKIKVNVTAGQLVAFFKLLYQIEPTIFNVKDQAELRTFIINNFITARTKGKSMNDKKTANHFSNPTAADIKHWIPILKKMGENAAKF